MSEQENLRVIKEAYDALNAHDLDRYTALLDDSYVWETGTLPAGPFVGREGARQAMEMYYRAFPNLHYDIEQNIASGDYVVTRWRIHATHDGDFLGIAPTNREGEIHGCNVSTLKNGKIVHAWVYFCTGRVLHQMGMLAVPG
jgi:predicted ester cyclase